MSRTPRVGDMVMYTLDQGDVDSVRDTIKVGWPNRGNSPEVGYTYPMMIVTSWSDGRVNGQVFLDGNFVHWATSVSQGEGNRHFQYPEDVPLDLDQGREKE